MDAAAGGAVVNPVYQSHVGFAEVVPRTDSRRGEGVDPCVAVNLV